MSNCAQPTSALRQQLKEVVPEVGGLEARSHPWPGGTLWLAEGSPRNGKQAMSVEELQSIFWKQFFADATLWWDSRRSNPNARHQDVRRKKIKACAESQPETIGAGFRAPSDTGSTLIRWSIASSALDGHLEVGICERLCHDGPIYKAVDALDLMLQQGYHIPSNLLYRVLKRSIQEKDLSLGRRIHALTVRGGYEGDAFLATHLIGLYASHGRLEEAMGVFTKVPKPDAYNWATLIFAYARHGEAAEAAEAIRLYRQMRQSTTIKVDDRLYSAVLKACAAARDLDAGKEVHAQIAASSEKPDRLVQAGLVNMYAKCGCLEDARNLFDTLSNRIVGAWNAMIAGYAQQGMGQDALNLYRIMKQEGRIPPNSVTYVSLLQACAGLGEAALGDGKQLHEQIRKTGMEEDVVLGGGLVNMYVKCGSLEDARKVFDKLPERNTAAWNSMIAGYSQQGLGQEALSLYSSSMQQEGLIPNVVTYVCLLQACASVGVAALDEGKQLHAQIKEEGLQEEGVLGVSLVNMYAKCCSLEDARSVFEKLPERNLVAWTAMIAGYAQQGKGEDALNLYRSMVEEGLSPDSVTYVCLLQACSVVGVGALDEGKQLHARIKELGLEKDVVLGGCLVNMHAKCGNLEDACIVFEKLPKRNLLAWTAMISGYAQQGMGQEALSLYSRMQQEGLTPPDFVIYVCLLQACAAVAALPLGEQLHAEIEARGMQAYGSMGAALVNMYAKCGSMHDAQHVFDSLSERTVEAWGALVGGYARQGDSQVVFDLLDRMRLEGTRPDEITFLSVLAVCSHVGLVDKGREYFEVMRRDYGIGATMEHYICMVDLLGRAGHLEEALQMANAMPFPPNDVVWRALLGACWKWKNVEIGQQAFKGALSVDEKDAASYVLMANIYASCHMWEASKEMQARRVKLGAWKKPGQSWWTDLAGVVHTFAAGDKKHPESDGIYARLDQLVPKMRKEGYVPYLKASLLDTPDDEKEAELCGHSEKLAIAYALNKTPQGTTIRIVKNLRVCEDCHRATAYISKVEERTIICRDASRFHVFQQGKCSCGDYW